MRLTVKGPETVEISDIGSEVFVIDGEAPTPLQFLGASLGMCSAQVLRTYAKNVANVGIDRLRLLIDWRFAERPHRVETFELRVVWPELPEERIDPVRRAVATCTVHRTLTHTPEIETSVER